MATGTKKYILCWFCLCSLFIGTLSILTLGVNGNEEDIPSESQCRPYIEKALKDLEAGELHSGSKADSDETDASEEIVRSKRSLDESSAEKSENDAEAPALELAEEPFVEEMQTEGDDSQEADSQSAEEAAADDAANSEESTEERGDIGLETSAEDSTPEDDTAAIPDAEDSIEQLDESQSDEPSASTEKDNSLEGVAEGSDEKTDDSSEGGDGNTDESTEEAENASNESAESEEQPQADAPDSGEDKADSGENNESQEANSSEEVNGVASEENVEAAGENSSEEKDETAENKESEESAENAEDSAASAEDSAASAEDTAESTEDVAAEGEDAAASAEDSVASAENNAAPAEDASESAEDSAASVEDSAASAEDSAVSVEDNAASVEDNTASAEDSAASAEDSAASAEDSAASAEDSAASVEDSAASVEEASSKETATEDEIPQGIEPAEESAEAETAPQDPHPEEDLLMEIVIPDNLRSKEHIDQMLRLDSESTESELLMEKSSDIILRELKRLYDGSIKPLEILYKYRDLSNRHFGDPEIFSKPLVLFMGPWSGGKSSLINYLTDNEFTEWSLRTGAEPSPAYFNILMHGKEPEVLDGTQLAADWTFSGLQKFGQGLEERLRGLKLPNKLLERVNIVEIPGILEVRKQVSRVFPFNDACQWFIDRADVIFLVYDPSKLDVGPETEAILDQLKGRESQTRIILNKADQVKPEELMRVQSALIWNISPLMSSAQPPVMYTTSLWSMPYEVGSPARLLQSQEKSFLRDLRGAIDKRIENKISSARRFAVRVRNHAKMVDCYLTTYYNHKTIFGNKKVVAEAIIEHPQNYHIYEGLSTLTNISRYDLPDPETYRDFFRLNPLYEFQQLSATCTYFRGCPINKLDVAISYDLPELVGKYKKMVESVTPQGMPKS